MRVIKTSILIIIALAAVVILGAGLWFMFAKDEEYDNEETHEEEVSEDSSGIIRDYQRYKLTIADRVRYGFEGGVISFILLFAFYKSTVFSGMIGIIAVIITPYLKKKDLINNRRKELTSQFKDGIINISDSLEVGNSVENGIRESLRELQNTYSPKSYIVREFKYIVRMMDNGENIETALYDLAERSGIDDIRNFADVFATCKRTSGDVRSVIKRTSEIISEKDDTIREIQLMVSDKKFEQKILNFMPVGMILLLSSMAGDFMQPMYTTPKGRVFMTGALGMFIVATFMSKKIMDIEV